MENNKMTGQEVIELINKTDVGKVITLDPVRQKFIANYEQANGNGKGELVYQKNAIYFNQRLRDDSFSKVKPMAVYKAWIMIAIRGYDLDPTAGEVYIMPFGETIDIQRQAPYMVRRLIESGQIQTCYPAQLVFEGDEIEIRDGMVTSHVMRLKSNKIIAGYVKMLNRSGKEICFIYRPVNWNQWRKKSKQQEGDNWKNGEDGQPIEAFLKTKIVKHACNEKCFASGDRRLTEDWFPEVEEKEAVDALAEVDVEDVIDNNEISKDATDTNVF